MSEKSSTRTSRGASAKDPAAEFAGWPIEKCFDELERIVEALEGEQIPLEESLRLFERGMILSRRCSVELAGIEKRIKIIVENTRGETQLKDFESEDAETD